MEDIKEQANDNIDDSQPEYKTGKESGESESISGEHEMNIIRGNNSTSSCDASQAVSSFDALDNHQRTSEMLQGLENDSTQSICRDLDHPAALTDDTTCEGQVTRPEKCASLVENDDVPERATPALSPDHTQPSLSSIPVASDPSDDTQPVLSSDISSPGHTQPSQLCRPNQESASHKSDHGDVSDHSNKQNCSEHIASGDVSYDHACNSEGHLTHSDRACEDSLMNSKSQCVCGDTSSQVLINTPNEFLNSNTNAAANSPSSDSYIHETDNVSAAQTTTDRKSCFQERDTSRETETETNQSRFQQLDMKPATQNQTSDSSNTESTHHELVEPQTSSEESLSPAPLKEQSHLSKPSGVVTESSVTESPDALSESNMTNSVTASPETYSESSLTKSHETLSESSQTIKQPDPCTMESTPILSTEEEDDSGSSVDPVDMGKPNDSRCEHERKICDDRESADSSENEFEDVISTISDDVALVTRNDDVASRREKDDVTIQTKSGDLALGSERKDEGQGNPQEQIVSNDDEASDDDEDFFDACDDQTEEGVEAVTCHSLDHLPESRGDENENTDNATANDPSGCQKNKKEEKPQDSTQLSMSSTSDREADDRNQPAKRRTWITEKPHISHSLWSVLKNCIGKELSKIPMPVNFSEPLSMLQRLTEELEYSEILDQAALCEDSCEQMAHVAAFTVSSYATTLCRTGKPFNPLLGETFEFDRTSDLGWRSFAEQVSHHPPTLATHAEGRGWTMWQEFTMTIKFRGRYIQIIPMGIAHLTFQRSGNHYTWRKVTTTVHNIIVGRLWVDNEGHMDISNHTTGDTCQLNYSAYSFFSREPHRKVTGMVKDSRDILRWTLTGTWCTQIEASPILHPPEKEDDEEEEEEEEEEEPSSSCYSRPGSKSKSGSGGSGDFQTGPSKVLWKVRPPPDGAEKIYFFSQLAIEMNELEEGVAPTDSRLRPDQRKMEDADWEEANRLKFLLEEKQRQARRRREAEAEQAKSEGTEVKEYQPTWFRKETDPITGNPLHVFSGDYWDCKQEQQWDRCPDIFL